MATHSTQNGDATIVGIFSNTNYFDPSTKQCSNYSLLCIQLTQVFIYTIDELVNNNPKLLPGIKLGWQLIDSCSSVQHATTLLTTVLANSELKKYHQYSCSQTSSFIHNFNSSTHSSSLKQSNYSAHTSPIIGVVGDIFDYITTLLASYTSSLQYAQISYFSFNPTLDNRRLFPYFFRTSSSGAMLGDAIYDVINKFKWNWVSVIYSLNQNLQYNLQSLSQFLLRRNVCIAYETHIHEGSTTDDITNIITVLKNQSRSKVVLIFGREETVYRFLKHAENQSLTGITWVGTYGWVLSDRIRKLNQSLIGGVIGISISRKSLSNFTTYLDHLDLCNNLKNPWFIQLVRENLNWMGNVTSGNTTNCSIDSQLKQRLLSKFFAFDVVSIFVADAILALAHALHHQLGCNETFCPPIDQLKFDRHRSSYLQFLRNVKFKLSSQEYFQFQSNGASTHNFDIINYQPVIDSSGSHKISVVKVGSWNQDTRLNLDVEKIIWNTGKVWHQVPLARCSDDCQPGSYPMHNPNISAQYRKCCWLCPKCQPQTVSSTINSPRCIQCVNFTKANDNQSECVDLDVVKLQYDSVYAIIYYVFAAIFIVLLAFIWIVMILYRHSPVVKGSNFILMNILLFFIALIVLAIAMDFIPIDQKICNMRAFVIFLVPAGHLLTVVSKTTQIWLIFRNQINAKPCQSKLMNTKYLVAFIGVSLLIFTGLLLIMVLNNAVVVRKIKTINNQVDFSCMFFYSPAIIILLIFIGILGISCFVLAFQVRKLPDNFNEARFIFMATTMLCCTSVCSAPIYLASTGELRRILGIAVLLIQGYATLLSYFLPKIYIIFLQPDRNQRHYAVASVVNFTMNQVQKSSAAAKPKSDSETDPVTF